MGENQDPGAWLLPEMFQKRFDFISLCSASTPQLPLSLTYLLAPSHSSLFTSKGCELSTVEILLLPWLPPACQLLNFPLGISWPSHVYLVLSTFCFLPPSSHQPLNHSAGFLQNLPNLAASYRLVVVQCYPQSSSSCKA